MMKQMIFSPAPNISNSRSGRVNSLWLFLAGAFAAVVVLVLMLRTGPNQSESGKKHLVLYCAAGLRIPVAEIANAYEEQYQVHIELQFAGSNTLLNKLQVNKFSEADLYLAADDFYTDKAVELKLAAETIPIAHQRPVIAVHKENAKQIKTLSDLLQPGVVVAVGNPDAAAIGKTIKKQLEKIEVGGTNRWAQLEEQVTQEGVFKPTVNEIANDVKIGSADAAIVWDSTVTMPNYRDDLVAIPVPELDSDPNLISIAVLRSSTAPTAAIKFARFLSARDQGLKTFEKYGTRPVEGDVWKESPEVSFFCGAVNRRAVEKIIDEFQEREGVIIHTKYNGCGVLTSEMKTIADQSTEQGFPDVYMACDRYYLDNVRDWFQDDVDVSDVELVIAVPKGSTKVSSLQDLLKPGVRVAIGQPEQCTIGALTRRMLQSENLYEKLKEKQTADGEVVVEKISSALLVPDVVTAHADVAIVYITDALPNMDDIDIVRVETTENVAVQPFSIAKTSDHKYLSRRLFRRISEAEKEFEAAGFHFRLGESKDPKSESDSL